MIGLYSNYYCIVEDLSCRNGGKDCNQPDGACAKYALAHVYAQHTQITSGVEILMLRQHKQKGWTKTNPAPAPPFDHMLSSCVCSMQ